MYESEELWNFLQPPPGPPYLQKKRGWGIVILLTHCQLRWRFWSCINIGLDLGVVVHPIDVEFGPPLLVFRVDQCMGPGPKTWDSLIPAGNCGPVSSDEHVLDRRVCILYKFMFYVFGRALRYVNEIGEL
jgi:hypothetical protein